MKILKLMLAWILMFALVLAYFGTYLLLYVFLENDGSHGDFVLAIFVTSCFMIFAVAVSVSGSVLSILSIKRSNKTWTNVLAIITCCLYVIILLSSVVWFI